MPTIAKAKTTKTTKTTKAAKTVNNVKTESLQTLSSVVENPTYLEAFKYESNPTLVSQYVRVFRFNQRKGNASSKTRGEVAGSGKKPWKQKGTGRARVGSIRNPVWRHGGVSHGPVIKDWSLNLPKKMKNKVFLIALSDKVAKSKAFYTEEIQLTEGRTKEALALIGKWNLEGRILIVLAKSNLFLKKGCSNLKDVDVCNYTALNAHQLLDNVNVVFEKEALDKIMEMQKTR